LTREFSAKILPEVPELPGVYLFSDRRGSLLYVGKAINLRNRLRSYLQKNQPCERIAKMVSQIHRMEFIVTETEVEALLLENSFIKNNKPVYNILLRDGKTYPYIQITAETFPRALLVRRKSRGGRMFGPFPSTRAARQTIRQIQQFFKIRNCDYDLDRKRCEPCLQYHLKRCDAPCDDRVESAEYMKGVERAIMFLKGENNELIEILNREMKHAGEKLAFERAAHFRDLIGLVRKVRHHQNVTVLPAQKIDVIGLDITSEFISLMILTVRGGMISRSKHFKLELHHVNEEIVSHLAHYYLGHADPPRVLVLRNPDRYQLLQVALKESSSLALELMEPRKGYKKKLLEMAEENARLHVVDRKPENVNILGETLSKYLKKPVQPNTIEGFDISNTQGTLSVASMVCFIHGRPSKKNYRKFKIKTVVGANDYASIQEVVHRRYRRLQDEHKPFPDLILIDGGPGQLRFAIQALDSLGIHHIPVVSLAKREELIYFPDCDEPIKLPETHEGLRLLQQVRDESHRFGIAFHRKRRAKNMLHSELQEIPGLGPKRIKKLLLTFGSVENIKKTSKSRLVQVLGKKTGDILYYHLKK